MKRHFSPQGHSIIARRICLAVPLALGLAGPALAQQGYPYSKPPVGMPQGMPGTAQGFANGMAIQSAAQSAGITYPGMPPVNGMPTSAHGGAPVVQQPQVKPVPTGEPAMRQGSAVAYEIPRAADTLRSDPVGPRQVQERIALRGTFARGPETDSDPLHTAPAAIPEPRPYDLEQSAGEGKAGGAKSGDAKAAAAKPAEPEVEAAKPAASKPASPKTAVRMIETKPTEPKAATPATIASDARPSRQNFAEPAAQVATSKPRSRNPMFEALN